MMVLLYFAVMVPLGAVIAAHCFRTARALYRREKATDRAIAYEMRDFAAELHALLEGKR